jgi:hypothetical protein
LALPRYTYLGFSFFHTEDIKDLSLRESGTLMKELLREVENAYLGSFSCTQMNLKLKSGDHLELQQGTGFPIADIRLWGTKDPFIRPSSIRTVRARIQVAINK